MVCLCRTGVKFEQCNKNKFCLTNKIIIKTFYITEHSFNHSHKKRFLWLCSTQVLSCEYCKIFKNSSFVYRAPLITTSVLWTITMLNFNRVLWNLRTMNDFNFTSNNLFQQVLLINFISTYANLYQHFICACFLLIED